MKEPPKEFTICSTPSAPKSFSKCSFTYGRISSVLADGEYIWVVRLSMCVMTWKNCGTPNSEATSSTGPQAERAQNSLRMPLCCTASFARTCVSSTTSTSWCGCFSKARRRPHHTLASSGFGKSNHLSCWKQLWLTAVLLEIKLLTTKASIFLCDSFFPLYSPRPMKKPTLFCSWHSFSTALVLPVTCCPLISVILSHGRFSRAPLTMLVMCLLFTHGLT
mmetsp:Transcript_78472/g.172015  ORF Transcript_78472/g.172015 Transcript_78472/m.172015 type:complete len:220 (+) Transcript_78472:660-1319(+)